jgi:hypothetical protein
VVVAPATFNTINKWALGIIDTLVLGILNEALGLGLTNRGRTDPEHGIWPSCLCSR